MKRLLYVTPLWSGLRDLLFEGAVEGKGMPAFIKPLQYFVSNGISVDLVVCSWENPDFKISANWLKNTTVKYIKIRKSRFAVAKLVNLFKIYMGAMNLLNKSKYDFVYGHGGSIGLIACILAHKMGIPCGQRLYGTFLSEKIRRYGCGRVFLKHPFEYLSFLLNNKNFLMVTNDGTEGDYVWEKITASKTNYKFIFPYNGIECQSNNDNNDYCIPAFLSNIVDPFLYYPARFDRWKRQDMLIEIINELVSKKRGIHVFFSGHVSDTKYYEEVFKKAHDYNIEKYVHYVGTLNKKEMKYMFNQSMATLFCYDFSNLGNAFIEALSNGALVIARKNKEIEKIIIDRQDGFLVENVDDCVALIEMLNSTQDLNKIREAAKTKAEEIFLSWEERCKYEYVLINNIIGERQ